MSNYKFKLSDMIPNGWFYKLEEIGKGRNQTTTTSTTTPSKNKKQSSSKPHYQFNPRKSYYFTRELNPNPNNSSLEPQRQSSKHKTRKRRTTSSSSSVSVSVSAGCSCRTKEQHSSSPFTTETESPDPELRTDRVLIPTETTFDEMLSLSTSFDDIVIDVDNISLVRKDDKLEEKYEYEYDDTFSKLQLPPIITNKKQHKHKKEEKQKQRSPGVKLRVNSPRIYTRRVKSYGKHKSGSSSGYQRDFSDSLAIVKSSFDPQKDFRESMVEMIVENNIRTTKDLEDLLACYLSLNSDEYHGVIIKVFKQIWFDLTQIS